MKADGLSGVKFSWEGASLVDMWEVFSLSIIEYSARLYISDSLIHTIFLPYTIPSRTPPLASNSLSSNISCLC